MPVPPSQWRTNFPITAHQLNQDLYTYDGSYFGANGVMFHSNRPMMWESYGIFGTPLTAAKGGTFYQLGGKDGTGISILDNAALYGTGSDGPSDEARFGSSGAIAPGSAGVAGEYGGWQLMFNSVSISGPFSGTNSTYGSAWFQEGNVLLDIGTIQQGASAWNVFAGFAVDLIQRTPFAPDQEYTPGVFLQDSGGASVIVGGSSVSTTGTVTRFGEIWMGVCDGNGTPVTSIPTPIASIGTATTLSAATLNTTIQQTFNLLNNPPMLSVQLQNTNAITANAVTVVPFTATPFNDNYSAYSTASTTYTVKIPGNYFCHANIIYATNWNTGSAVAGFQVNGTNYFGGAYNATPVGAQNTSAAVTKILDLHAGDTVKVVTKTSTNSNFGNANVAHWVMAWLSPVNTSTQTWNPPDVTGFQFMAGTAPGTAPTHLAGLMNVKVANDVNFLLNRPYLTVHQSTANSGMSQSGTVASSNYTSPTMQAVTGLVHGGNGDNYAGWSTANNYYVAPVNGWYFAVTEINSATVSTANSTNMLGAGFFVPSSGGVNAPGGFGGPPDWYQLLTVAQSWTYPTGATAIGVYYLLAGETIQPIASVFTTGTLGTWATDVTHNFLSHFNVFWMSNLGRML